jgi:SRSO17 transposase
MQLPIVGIAPIVAQHGADFQELFQNKNQFRHFQNYLTGLTVLDNKSMANMARCLLDSADKSNISRFFSEAKWSGKEVNAHRLQYMLRETSQQRRPAKDSVLPIDDTLCEHVGSLFEYVDRHYNHSDQSYPLSHNLVTAHYVSGPVRFPVDFRVYRRYEEFTQWETYVAKHFPEATIPTQSKARNKFRQQVEPTLLTDVEFRSLHESFQTKITLATELVRYAIAQGVPFETVLFDSWYLAPELLAVLEENNKNWISILKSNRNVLTSSFVLKDAEGHPIRFDDSKIQIQELVPFIPTAAFKPVEVDDRTCYCFTKTVRLASLGKVRLVVSFDNPDCTGTYVLLVTNCLSWSAEKIIATYLLRWPIETFYQDSKQHLGLDDYRMRNMEAIQKHWSLVSVAYSFLHLDCLPKSTGQKDTSPSKSLGQAVRQQGRYVIEALIMYAHRLISEGQSAKDVFDSLFAKQEYSLAL